MPKPAALALVAASSLLCLVTLAWEGAISAWIFSLAVAVFPVGLIALAAPRKLFLAALALLQVGGLGGVLLLASRSRDSYLGGLPAATAVLLYGVGLATLVLTTWVYAVTFDRHGIREEELQRLRRLREGGV